MRKIERDQRDHVEVGADSMFSLRFLLPVPFRISIQTVALAEGWPTEGLALAVASNVGWLELKTWRNSQQIATSPNFTDTALETLLALASAHTPSIHQSWPRARLDYMKGLCSTEDMYRYAYCEMFTLRESPQAHPKTATFAKCTGYRELSVCALCLSTGGRRERRLRRRARRRRR